MSIRDIIEAADPHGWYSANAFASPADGCFIATFDPEHVALMEAVCEAAKARHQEWTRDTYITRRRYNRPPSLPKGAWTVTPICRNCAGCIIRHYCPYAQPRGDA